MLGFPNSKPTEDQLIPKYQLQNKSNGDIFDLEINTDCLQNILPTICSAPNNIFF
jgi:hypothetical protein